MAIKTVWPDDSQILNSIHKGEHFLLAKTLGKSLFHLQTDWLGNDLASQFWQMESPLSYILYALNHVRFPSHCKWYSLVTGFTILQLKIPCVAGGIVFFVHVRVLTAKPPPHQERAPKASENYKASCPHSLWSRNSYASMRTLTILPAMQAKLKVL